MSSISITDLYRQLFGRSGTTKGSDIDMAEHGRAGGVSTGQPYKAIQEVPLKIILDEPDASTTYVGEANHGTATTAAAWRIKKIVVSGTLTTISYAGGNDNFNKIWDDRASLAYS